MYPLEESSSLQILRYSTVLCRIKMSLKTTIGLSLVHSYRASPGKFTAVVIAVKRGNDHPDCTVRRARADQRAPSQHATSTSRQALSVGARSYASPAPLFPARFRSFSLPSCTTLSRGGVPSDGHPLPTPSVSTLHGYPTLPGPAL